MSQSNKDNKDNKDNKSKGNKSNNKGANQNIKPPSNPKPQVVGNGSGKGTSEFECPVCMDIMSPPIYLCESGHSICNNCCKKLVPPKCPFCQAVIKQTRNYALEAMIEKIRLPCSNKIHGCKYTVMQGEVEKHQIECIFRNTDCIFGTIFGKCSWSGPIPTMLAHCKERHGENTSKVKLDSDIVLNNFKPDVDERILQLVEVGSQLCYYHFKVDTLTGNAYWLVQLVATANYVKDWIYEVHILNRNAPERKVKFVDMCKMDSIPIKSIFESCECAMLPLSSLKTFIDNKKNLVVKINIKSLNDAKKKNKGDQNANNNNKQNQKQQNQKPQNQKE